MFVVAEKYISDCRMDLTLSIALPVGLGGVAGFMTSSETQGQWYQSLKKPSWTPPKSAFGPVWVTLYILMGIAAWRVWRAGGRDQPMLLYGAQLALNIAWSFLFFKAHNLQWALFDIVALLGMLIATTYSFYGVDQAAGHLMIPYVAWVSLATALTANLYINNPAGAS